MTGERLNALAIISIEWQVAELLNLEDLADSFIRLKKRRFHLT